MILSPAEFESLMSRWKASGIESVAMDFEEESNLHCYGEHLCIIQLFDGTSFYIVDALALAKSSEGLNAMKSFLEGSLEKVMFACQSDASLARKTLGIQLNNICDVRIYALALGFNGNLTALIERNLGICVENQVAKKKFQIANWMRRPIPADQIEYALSDVRYLFDLKASLEAEVETKLTEVQRKKVSYDMKRCALQKNPERPGWEKICNFKILNASEKVYIKHFFLARDSLARKENVPAARILDKRLVVAMAKKGTWKGILEGVSKRYCSDFEVARLDAEAELNKRKV